MASKYTEMECLAIDRKFERPAETVMCPRCKKELLYREVNGSCEVICETNGCLYDAIRGI